MVVLGVDPGFVTTGFGILKKEQNRVLLIDHGALSMKSSDSIAHRIGLFYSFFNEKIVMHGVTVLALETPFLGKNAQNFLKLGYLRGALYLLSDQHNIELGEFAPREVKAAVTGFGGADKEQVARMVMRFFPALNKPNKLDVTDALAVSLCGL